MNEQFSEADIKRFQDAKNKQKRTVVLLDDGEVVEFARMLKSRATLREFKLKFNMSSIEVERQRQMLGLATDDIVDEFLKAIDEQPVDVDKKQEMQKEDRARQKRLDAMNAGKQGKKKTTPVQRVSTAEQQEALNKIEDDKKNIKPKTQYDDIEHYQKVTGKRFRISPAEKKAGLTREEAFIQRFSEPVFSVSKEEEEQFKSDARLGMKMLCNKYGAKRSEIAAELKRLGVDLDMLKR